jgi:hypothetical protein
VETLAMRACATRARAGGEASSTAASKADTVNIGRDMRAAYPATARVR